MARYILRRLAESVVVLAVMSFVIYALIGLMPGDPIDLMLSADPHLTPADAERLKALMGIDQPLMKRYLAWAAAALQGDFGYSRLYVQPAVAALLALATDPGAAKRFEHFCREDAEGVFAVTLKKPG